MAARRPTPAPARSWCRSTRPAPTRSPARACTRASSIRAPTTRPASPTSAAWRRWKAAAAASPSPPGWRRPRPCWNCSTAATHVIAMDDLYGGSYRLFERVRRRSAGLDFSFVDLTDPAAFEAAITPEHEAGLDRNPDQPAAEDRRHRRDRRDREEARPAGRRRQHLRLADPAAPARTRRRHRHAFGDQVPQRPFRHRRRHARGRRQSRAGRAARLPAELDRRGAGAVRQLPRAARPEDAAPAHAARTARTRRRWRNSCKPIRRSRRWSIRAWNRIRTTRWRSGRWMASAASFRSALKGGFEGAKRFCERTRTVHAGRVAGRRREPGQPSGGDDPRVACPPERRAALGIDDNLVRLSVGVESVGGSARGAWACIGELRRTPVQRIPRQ